jgi:hypothetical protein
MFLTATPIRNNIHDLSYPLQNVMIVYNKSMNNVYGNKNEILQCKEVSAFLQEKSVSKIVKTKLDWNKPYLPYVYPVRSSKNEKILCINPIFNKTSNEMLLNPNLFVSSDKYQKKSIFDFYQNLLANFKGMIHRIKADIPKHRQITEKDVFPKENIHCVNIIIDESSEYWKKYIELVRAGVVSSKLLEEEIPITDHISAVLENDFYFNEKISSSVVYPISRNVHDFQTITMEMNKGKIINVIQQSDHEFLITIDIWNLIGNCDMIKIKNTNFKIIKTGKQLNTFYIKHNNPKNYIPKINDPWSINLNIMYSPPKI